MHKLNRSSFIVVLAILVGSCAVPVVSLPTPSPTPEPSPRVTSQPAPKSLPEVSIARYPRPVDYSIFFPKITSIPKYDPGSGDPFQVDLRSRDLTKIDMTGSLTDLMYADFDSKTQWPAADKMPPAFDWQKIMEIGKDPGLGIRNLHDQGVTGKGVGIAIIDHTLLVHHIEYKDRLCIYEEADEPAGKMWEAQMHGPAVASIAVGQSVGVAPEADLYYIATEEFNDFSVCAEAIERIIEINKTLPEDRKIRVLSMSVGWGPQNMGYEKITKAVNEAKAEGIFVISSNLSETDHLKFHGLGREPFADPDEFTSYGPGLFWEPYFFYQGSLSNTLLVPMDSRTTASPTGKEDYAYGRVSGWSWAIPYLAGMYALAVQVKPDITPEEFWEVALKTGRTIPIQHEGKEYQFGVILDPQALIAELKNR
jgi:hypothetical protein